MVVDVRGVVSPFGSGKCIGGGMVGEVDVEARPTGGGEYGLSNREAPMGETLRLGAMTSGRLTCVAV